MAAEPYKVEILEDILAKDPAAPITVYHVGAPSDALCVQQTSELLLY